MSEITIRELLASASTRLAGFDSARLDGEILLSSVIEKGREFVYSHPEQQLNQKELADFNSLVDKRCSGYPVAYLTGIREFWSLQLMVDSTTLIPRPETERLVELALELTSNTTNQTILELGTGSGAIAIAIASERPRSRLIATDISSPALTTASRNAVHFGLNNIRFLESDWFSNLGREKFDLILCNPPYVKSGDPGFSYGEIRHEPRIALDGGASGLNAYHQIIPPALKHLVSGGFLILEHGALQADAIRGLLHHNGFKDIKLFKDLAGHDRVTTAVCP